MRVAAGGSTLLFGGVFLTTVRSCGPISMNDVVNAAKEAMASGDVSADSLVYLLHLFEEVRSYHLPMHEPASCCLRRM